MLSSSFPKALVWASMANQPSFTARLKKLGFARGNQMRLYGGNFEIAGEPIIISDDEVLVDTIDVKLGTVKRMRIPLPVLKVAHEKKRAA